MACEFRRDQAAALCEARTGSAWKPLSGSKVNHRALTAAVIDSRDFINAKRRAETEIFLHEGPRILVTGGVDYQDHHRIWAALDKVKAKHPGMVLLHGRSEEHTSELQSLMRKSYADFGLQKKK